MSALLLSLLLACSTPAENTKGGDGEPTEEEASEVEADARLNVNTASEEELLEGVPDLTEKMAKEFKEYRPYKSIVQFRKQMGKYVDQKQVQAYEEHIFVPVKFNSCDGPTLVQIAGVNDATAKKLAAGRPYDDTDAFVAKLGDLIGEDKAEAARPLLVE